ncbi:SSI family serine proteinase inhibitor [Streptosporangium sp. NPDC051022]|uniref:SSI family serine proteinase inhibitor n=1 Tax=Streptosporangium sp. NPDC051022 TaxID=3155752 RepID=UPI00344A0470
MRTVKIVSAAVTFLAATTLHTTSSPASDSSSGVPGASAPVSPVSPALPVSGTGSALTLSLSVAGGPARSVLLRCDRDDTGLPSFATACGMLRRFGGDLAKMTYDIDMICDEEYVPHTVNASGTWEGRPVRFSRTYDNRCEMTALTGPVFSF